ncbi:aKG-HExxH-type peptide beta-hydroxylase [Streptomyces olivochromogenes]|uniref:aKG-HExxH-type peptide beta-hydroxylase n=1 Tax=Streptomyces olivochromogenes TaxID=1963 RepID=UPI00131B91F8|nr:HEXXH motif-containing putative peptide modification protein [Streptomyces olivochromogenes]
MPSDHAHTGLSLFTVSMPLAVPQRRVPPDRLRGRETLVDELTDALSRRADDGVAVPGVWLLSGMGGCGKTTVALEVAHRLTGALTQVWWVSGADDEGLSAALRAVAFAAGAAPSDFIGAHPADALWRRLESLTAPWLLILDNIDDPAVLAAAPSRTAEGTGWLRPPGPQGSVLITSRESRAERWGHWVHMVNVEPLSGGDGAQVLRDLAPRAGSERDAQELAEHLGGLPLALDLAGTYLARTLNDPWPSPSTPNTFAAYRHSLGARLADMASDPDADLAPAERTRRTILSTWELSLDLLHRQGADLARPLLRLLSAFGPAPIPYQDLLDLDLLTGSELFPHPTLPRFQEALRSLAGLKLVNIETTNDMVDGFDGGALRWITIHPMVRAASRAHPAFAAQAPPMLRLVSALLQQVTSPLDGANPAHWPRLRAIAPHGSAALLLLSACERDVEAVTADLVVAATEPAVRTALYYLHVGMFGEAIAELKTAGEARTRLLGEEDPDTIASGLALAWALRASGDLIESDDLYQRLAIVCERSLPAGHPYLQSVRTGRARTLGQLGRYEAAEAELRVALTLRQRDPQAGARSILRIRSDVARMAHNQGRFDEAATKLREVRRLTRALAREGELDSLAVGPSLVRALRDAGHAEEAEAVAEEVVEEHHAVLPQDHPALLIARHERARLLRDHEWDRGLLERARDEFTDIWQASERQLGSDHPDTIAARHELATVWHLLGHLDRAAEHFQATLEAGKRRLGEHHPHVAVCARNLAMVLTELDDKTAPSPNTRDGRDGPYSVDTSQGAFPVDDTRQIRNPQTSELPALARLSLEEALSPERNHVDSSPALARLLDRFARADQTASAFMGDGGGPGYSSGSHPSRTPPSALRRYTASTYRPLIDSGFAADLFEPVAESVAPDAADIQALAKGEDDRHLIKRLRAQQRGIRLLALRDILDRTTTVMAERADTMPSIQQVRRLLTRADHANPQAVTTVLLHPSVGRWMSRTLRALHGFADEPSGPLPADLLHLHSVVAAAAVRAGIRFNLLLPLRDGFAFLPTLGAADLRSSRAITARIHWEHDSPTITCGRTTLQVPTSAENIPPAWHPAHRVQTPVGPGHFDFVLDDMDPHRETSGPLAPSPLPQAEVTNWAQLTRDAANLLARVDPRQAEALAVALKVLTPRPADPNGVVSSASSSDAFGGLVASTPPDGVELAATLIHEFQHMKLNAVLDCLKLHDEGNDVTDEAYYAPWRDDPRPLPGLFHGVFAFIGVVEFWRKLTLIAEGETLRRAQFQLHYWSTQTRDAFTELCSSPRLTEAGRNFAALMGSTIATWTDNAAAVPDHVAALAMEAVVAHRMHWRLHHLCPEASAVATLAEAWLSGVPHPPRQRITIALSPDPNVPSSNAYTALLYQAATASSEPDSARTPRLGAKASSDRADPADLARLRGSLDEALRLSSDQVTRWPERHETWIRLALALRRAYTIASTETPGTNAAARALTHRPEVVRAVHARVAAVTATPPDPIALAAWIGLMDDTARLPALPRMDQPHGDTRHCEVPDDGL